MGTDAVEHRLLYNYVETAAGCWEWTGARDGRGYGRLLEHGVHRLAYVYWIGPIPEGLYVLHSCDNPPCYNPHHLRLGDADDNAADLRAKRFRERSER